VEAEVASREVAWSSRMHRRFASADVVDKAVAVELAKRSARIAVLAAESMDSAVDTFALVVEG